MGTHEFLPRARGRVRIRLTDGTVHDGRFRTDILTPSALAAYFFGDDRDMSLPISAIEHLEPLTETVRTR